MNRRGFLKCLPIAGLVARPLLAADALQQNVLILPFVTHFGGSSPLPDYDTLLGIANPLSIPVIVRLQYVKSNGQALAWSNQEDYYDYRLGSQQSIAMTHIPGNPFVNPVPPQNFTGYGKVSFWSEDGLPLDRTLPAQACIGGGDWNTFSGSVRPLSWNSILEKDHWILPYAIPYFENSDHNGSLSYRTAIVLTNLSDWPATYHIHYRVGNFYPEAGQQCEHTVTIGPGAQWGADMSLWSGHSFNSEGWIEISSDQLTKTVAYVLASNREYNRFSFGYVGDGT